MDTLRVNRWYPDNDGDGFGYYDPEDVNEENVEFSCTPLSGHVQNFLDCDDSDADIFPLADERCDEIDNDCDGVIDESSASDVITWYADNDNDGFGTILDAVNSCTQPHYVVRR